MKRRIKGCGFSCVDVIEYDGKIVEDIGGTCANVLSILNFMNWESELWIPKYEDPLLNKCLSNRGIQCVEFTKTKKNIPRVVQINDRDTKQHRFLTRCPQCGHRFAECILPTAKQVEEGVCHKESLFYCDRISEGISKLAELTKDNHGYTMYEPNGFRIYNQFIKCCERFDIVKFSEEKLSDRQKETILDDLQKSTVKLIIMTKGQLGLRFAYRDKFNRLTEWNNIDAVPTEHLKDSSGAGDWLTASFLNYFFSWSEYIDQFENYDYIKSCLYKAMQIASLSCGHIGAQGALRDEKILEIIGGSSGKFDAISNAGKLMPKGFHCISCGARIV